MTQSTRIFQNAFIVNDLEASIHKWVTTMGVGPWVTLENINLPNSTYRGKPTELTMHAALAAVGEAQVELIMPLHDYPSVYRDFFSPGEEGFHHVGILTEDREADAKVYEDRGHEIISWGGDPAGTCIAYIDTWASTQCCVELIQPEPSFLEMHKAMQEASAKWDGKTEIFFRR